MQEKTKQAILGCVVQRGKFKGTFVMAQYEVEIRRSVYTILEVEAENREEAEEKAMVDFLAGGGYQDDEDLEVFTVWKEGKIVWYDMYGKEQTY